jgi:hypothetical protein
LRRILEANPVQLPVNLSPHTCTVFSDIVNKIFSSCVSKVEMLPLTAGLKCLHETREDAHRAEAVTEVASDEEGGGMKDHYGCLTGRTSGLDERSVREGNNFLIK